ncbi:alkaline phosphatase [Massilia sp. Root418]|uniref:alkaline phosphatase D family protein n=1 Tax=Massilia sp. Root418 TaxID=1736532 RepID=UPI0006FF9490|nr:alkaline phosphatase D family protein [Massilia sp. Root418]KQX00458.1 alkaline phosphatase [Massilia sp. Root418]
MEAGRRNLLLTGARLSALAAMAAAGATLAGSEAGGGAQRGRSRGAAQAGEGANGAGYPFSLGVASGSPLPTAVVLWTRILYDPFSAAAMPPLALSVRWEVAHDEAFRSIAARGTAMAPPELAHSVHVDVSGLAPGRWYWYRFMLGDAVSPTGRTRTAPAPDSTPSALKLAVASCQHWEFGSYAAHRHIAAAAPELVAFLGDYIYEWGAYQRQHPQRAVRVDESFTLDQYRARYAQYKSDPDLQAAHHAAPWILTWDDHEVANDYAGDRDERLSASFAARRAAAYQAYYEHQPIRLDVQAGGYGSLRMHQRYDWGRLARFHVLDNRQYRAPQACTVGRGGSSSVYWRECAALRDPAREMLGAEQQRWLEQGLKQSKARWNILAQQTLMAGGSQVPLVNGDDGRYWTDGWDGYPAARQRLYRALRGSGAANPLVLSGDVHTFYAAELTPDGRRPASAANPVLAHEFCGTSITSGSRPQARTLQYVDMNPQLKYGRSDKRGFMLFTITPERSSVQFQGLDDVRNPASPIATLASFTVPSNTNTKMGSGLIKSATFN